MKRVFTAYDRTGLQAIGEALNKEGIAYNTQVYDFQRPLPDYLRAPLSMRGAHSSAEIYVDDGNESRANEIVQRCMAKQDNSLDKKFQIRKLDRRVLWIFLGSIAFVLVYFFIKYKTL